MSKTYDMRVGINMKLHKKLFSVIVAFIPVIFLIASIIWKPLYTYDSLLCDRIYTTMDGISPKIKIIAVDEETLEAYGIFQKWSREKTADLIEMLYEDETKAPALTALDFLFIDNGDAQADARLAEACAGRENIIVASNLVYRGTTEQSEYGGMYYNKWNVDSVEKPYEELSKVVQSGYTNAYIAEDGCIRYTKLTEQYQDVLIPSFAWLMYETYEKQQGGEFVKPTTTANGQVTFFYSGKVGEFPHFSMKSVMDGTVPIEEFKDCIVLIGAYAPGFQDAYTTSAEKGNPMYGVEIQANILQALMERKTAVPLSGGTYLLVSGIVMYLFFLLARKQKLFSAISEACILIFLHFLTGKVLAGRGYTIPQIYFAGIMAVGVICMIGEKYCAEIIRRKRVLSTFKKYVAPQVVDQLAKDNNFKTRIEGEKREVAVLFVDLRDFTALSESLAPEQVVKILNEYLALTTSCILQNNGMLDKFIGDATMAVFNAPVSQEDYVYQAVHTAIDMQKEAEKLTVGLEKQFDRKISFGIGIHCGEAVIGNIGCEFRMDYTAIGDTVNTAARLESRAGAGDILISEAVYREVKDRVDAETVGEMELKGKSRRIMVYRVLGIKEEN